MYSRGGKEDGVSEDSIIIKSGPGNVKHHKEKHSTVIQWPVSKDVFLKDTFSILDIHKETARILSLITTLTVQEKTLFFVFLRQNNRQTSLKTSSFLK